LTSQKNTSFTYDNVGNRLTYKGSVPWQYSANNELLTTNDATYDYDANGNTISRTEGSSVVNFIYDIENRLIRVEDGSSNVIAQYAYDPFGRRLSKTVDSTTTYYFYADEGLIGEYTSDGTQIKAYGYKPGSTWTTDPLFMKRGRNALLLSERSSGHPAADYHGLC